MLNDLEKLLDTPLIASGKCPVIRNGVYLQGITKKISEKYHGHRFTGAKKKTNEKSSKIIGLRVHGELQRIAESDRVMNPHPWTIQALRLLFGKGLQLVAAEVPIAWKSIGTRIDLLAISPLSKGIILISLKTGYRRGPSPRSTHLAKPFQHLRASDQALDEIQIMAEKAITRQGYGILFENAYILEVPEGKLRSAPCWTNDFQKQDDLLNIIMSK